MSSSARHAFIAWVEAIAFFIKMILKVFSNNRAIFLFIADLCPKKVNMVAQLVRVLFHFLAQIGSSAAQSSACPCGQNFTKKLAGIFLGCDGRPWLNVKWPSQVGGFAMRGAFLQPPRFCECILGPIVLSSAVSAQNKIAHCCYGGCERDEPEHVVSAISGAVFGVWLRKRI